MRQILVGLLIAAGLAMAGAAPAQDSQMILSARKAGLIGERYDGYIGVVAPTIPAELRRQVGAINIRRRALYSNLAERKGASPQEVGITAACSLFKRIAPGEYYLPPEGQWRRHEAGTSPLPSYCT